jgi:outer membrane protein OmpA-like peptidoglycan-associated protein
MRRHAAALTAAVLLVPAALLAGCGSVYQSTYDQTYQKLESQAAAERRAEEEAHAAAQRDAGVVYFQTGSAVIQQEGYREISWFVQQLQPYPKAIIEVRGFTDSTGSEGENQKLSDARADAVTRVLVMDGIDPSRIKKLGYGDAFQAATNRTAEGRRDNRRVEITVE